MKSHKNLYQKLCSYNNIKEAFEKAKKNKGQLDYIIEFEKDLKNNLLNLKKELESLNYQPLPLKKFVIRDPKTRVIRKSDFRDRIVHHAIVNVLEPIYEKIFIYDSYANRLEKGTIAAIKRFDYFKRKVSRNGILVKDAKTDGMVRGYVFKGDVKHFFDSINQDILIKILRRKIKDDKLINLISKILKNFDDNEKGVPLGNMTSQFFANVYLNDLDYFVKHNLKSKYYIRYVDDFVILHEDKNELEIYKEKINKYLKNLKLELHPDKSKIYRMNKGVDLLGFRIFYYHKLLRKRNIMRFNKKLLLLEEQHKKGIIEYEQIMESVEGWFAYAMWGNTYKLRKDIIKEINKKYLIIN